MWHSNTILNIISYIDKSYNIITDKYYILSHIVTYIHPLFFLLPPSCIVTSIGNIVNKVFFPSTFSFSTMSNSQAFILPTMFPPNYIGMNIPAGPVPVNGSEVRGRTFSTKKNYSRDMSMSSTWSSVIYHERIANNGMDVDPETSPNRTRQDKSSQEIKDTNKNQRSGKLSRICKFLQKIHPELQSYSKTIKWVKRKEGMGMNRRTSIGIWRIKREDNKPTLPSEERR